MSQSQRIKAIVARARELDTGEEDCFESRHPEGNEYWERGAAAFRQDVRLEDCPLAMGTEQDDWLRGWMAAELLEFDDDEDEL